MSSSHDFTHIPIIDLSLAEDPSTLPGLLSDLRTALTEVGFLYVSNHSVSPSVIERLVNILPRLFTLPEEAKKSIALENSPHFLGYSGAGAESTAGKADQREQVEFATELEETWKPGMPLYERLRGPNQWPRELPELEDIVTSYISELTTLGETFLQLVAKALSLPDKTFLPFLSDQHRLKLVHYPKSEAGAGQGVGPHKDSSGWWTFLLQASPPEVKGLQVLNKAGSWIDVPVLPGTFVVNIGQAFEVVTHGICKATTHRVLSGSSERFSIPFFQGVRRDLTRTEALDPLKDHFKPFSSGKESAEGVSIDSAFLRGTYDTWGETQLRTKVRSHRESGRKFYGEVALIRILGDHLGSRRKLAEVYYVTTSPPNQIICKPTNYTMAFELPHPATFTPESGNQYSYIHIEPTSRDTTLLFLHGFPSTSYDWIYQIKHFSSRGYGLVVPDLLGYGQSSKPEDAHSYRLKSMSDEVVELLDSLGLSKVVGIGHDFGSTFLSRAATYHPSRWMALVFLAVGPPRLGTPFDVDVINRMTKDLMGFEMLGYIPWLGGDVDAQSALERHPEAAMSLMFAADRHVWDEWFHPLGKMKQFVTEDRKVPMGKWYIKELQQKHLQAFGVPEGYKGATRWYKMWKDNLFATDEKGYEGVSILQPSLFVGPKEPEASAAQQEQMLSGWVSNLVTVRVDSGHWVHLERQAETNRAINDFLLGLT
ncbi:hypothetical protein G7046_g9131 [Stylonectria norvegica]|nr:hypothetical protein G7046_g9131 [Stylonectria norvegica]